MAPVLSGRRTGDRPVRCCEEVPEVTMPAKVAALVLIVALVLTAGCWRVGRAPKFTGEYQIADLAEAPEVLQAHYAQMKALPGLAVLQQDGKTYLLLMAGRMQQPGFGVDVLMVQVPEKESKSREVTISARLWPGKGTEAAPYPYTLLVFDGTPKYTFTAGLGTAEGRLDLPTTVLTSP